MGKAVCGLVVLLGVFRCQVLSGVEVAILGVGATSSCRSRSSVSSTVVLSNSMTSIHPEIFWFGTFFKPGA